MKMILEIQAGWILFELVHSLLGGEAALLVLVLAQFF